MLELMAIAIGGAFGAVSRYLLANLSNDYLGSDFPYGTLFINVFGSLLMGVLFVILVERTLFPPIWRSSLMIGFLGAFTTFSSFSLQTLSLIEAGRLTAAASYAFASVVVCTLAVAIGIFLTRELTT